MISRISHITFIVKDLERAALFFKGIFDADEDVGAELAPERPRVTGEGRSIYFYDFDNHLFELHTGTLSERLACYSSPHG